MNLSVFAAPERLGWLAVVVPLLLLGAWRARERRGRAWRALAQAGRPPADGAIGWGVAAMLLVVALAQPRWGRATAAPRAPGRDVVIALDVSRSMACEDAVPNRLGLAVEAAVSLVRGVGASAGDRAAVVAFAGRGVLRCPLTQSLGAVVETLQALRPGDVAPGGTDLAAALDAAAEALDDPAQPQGRTIVVFSDGEDHAGTWPRALERLRARDPGVIVHAVAVGDADAGAPVLGRTPGAGPLTYQGAPVVSRRVDADLAALAAATGGAFVPLGLASTDLGVLYRDRIAPVAAARRDEAATGERADRSRFFVLAALVSGLLASRPRELRWQPGASASPAVVAGLVLLIVGAGPPQGSPARLVEAGRSAYAAGRFAEALDAFERAATLAPADPIARYDVAAALFQLGRHDEAESAYRAARPLASGSLRVKIDFGLGNTALARGALAEAIEHYDACLASTADDPASAEVRRRSRANRDFAEQRAKQAADSAAERPAGSQRPGSTENQGQEPGAPPPGQQPSSSGGGSEPPSSNSRGPGGAGGSGSEPPPPAPGSPESQLQQALEQVREARSRRLDDTPRPDAAAAGEKDW